MAASPTPAAPHQESHGALAPLREPVFRMLWLAGVAANLTMWMNDVAAARPMTQLTTSPADGGRRIPDRPRTRGRIRRRHAGDAPRVRRLLADRV